MSAQECRGRHIRHACHPAWGLAGPGSARPPQRLGHLGGLAIGGVQSCAASRPRALADLAQPDPIKKWDGPGSPRDSCMGSNESLEWRTSPESDVFRWKWAQTRKCLAVQKCLRFVAAPSPALNWLDQMGSQARPQPTPLPERTTPMSYRKAFAATSAALVVSLTAPVLSLAPAAAAPKSETGLPIEITKAVNGRWLQPDQVEKLRSADPGEYATW